MKNKDALIYQDNWPTLSNLPLPARALVTATVLILGLAMLGALGQIIVHDVIPTFFGEQPVMSDRNKEIGGQNMHTEGKSASRGDLFADLAVEEKEAPLQPFYKTEQFVWLLKWSHIHLFGMNMIFILMGVITIFLNMSARTRFWLVILPFAGVLIDIAAMWLKAYVSPVFFWLHLPGGGLFGAVFAVVSLKAMFEMWSAAIDD